MKEYHHQNIKSSILNYYIHFLFLKLDFKHIIVLYFLSSVLNSLWIIQLCELERRNNSISLNKMVYGYIHSFY